MDLHKILTFSFFAFSIVNNAFAVKKSVNAQYTLQNLHYLYKNVDIDPSLNAVLLNGPKHIVANRYEEVGRYTKLPMDEYLKQLNWSQSVFVAGAGSGNGNGTAFYVGGDFILTNKHVAETDHINKRCGYFSITTEIPEKEKLGCKKVHYCSPVYDFCLIEMNKFKNGESLASKIAPFKFKSTLGKNEFSNIYAIGNAVNYGIQGSKGLKMIRQDVGSKKEFIHYVPTFGGSSGSPIISEEGKVLGINYAGKVLFPDSYTIFESEVLYNYAVPSEVIIEELRANLAEEEFRKLGQSTINFKTQSELNDLIRKMKSSLNSDANFNELISFIQEKGSLFRIVNTSIKDLEKEIRLDDDKNDLPLDIDSYVLKILGSKSKNIKVSFVKLFNSSFINEPALALKDKKNYINVVNECNRQYHYYWTDGCIFENLFKPTFENTFGEFNFSDEQKDKLWSELLEIAKKSNNRYFSFTEADALGILSKYAREEISNLDFFIDCLLLQKDNFYHLNSVDCKNVTSDILAKNGYTYVTNNLASRVYHGFAGDRSFLRIVESFQTQVTKINFSCLTNAHKCEEKKYREVINAWDYAQFVSPIILEEIVIKLAMYHRR